MKVKAIFFVCLFIMMVTAACAAGNEQEMDQSGTGSEEILALDWSEVVSSAEGTEVNIFMWGGDEGINQYMDEWVAPRLEEQFGVILNRTPMDTEDILQKLMTEKQAGQDTGTIDIIWINGDNFRNAKRNDVLWGPFASQLPNLQEYIDSEDAHVYYDQGTQVEGLEAPWGSAQYVFFYDQEHVDNPPQTFAELKEWLKHNPGKFTYPNPTDFTGTGFLSHLMYESVGNYQLLLDSGYDEAFVTENSEWMWDYLNDIKPHLWRQGETYPESLSQLDTLYSQGDVWMTMGFNEGRAESLIESGTFPESTRSFVLASGSIGSVHYLSIPYNSPEPKAAMVAINYMLSPEAQIAKIDPNMWGENMVLDPDRLSVEERQKLDDLDRGSSVLPANVLNEAVIPEADAQYKQWLKENWLREVVQP